jgi:hypothetical protein
MRENRARLVNQEQFLKISQVLVMVPREWYLWDYIRKQGKVAATSVVNVQNNLWGKGLKVCESRDKYIEQHTVLMIA